jgi:hypothetical protein
VLPAGLGTFALVVLFSVSAVAQGGGRPGWIMYGVVSIVLSARVLLARVHACEEGVVVHNPIRSHRLSWSQIDSFSMDPVGPLLKVGTVHLVSGETLRMWGLTRDEKASHRDRATRYVDELNRLLATYRR